MTVSDQQTKSNKMKTPFLRLRGVEGAQAKPTCLQPGGGAESIDMKLSSFVAKIVVWKFILTSTVYPTRTSMVGKGRNGKSAERGQRK
jgi:hypothetical protein